MPDTTETQTDDAPEAPEGDPQEPTGPAGDELAQAGKKALDDERKARRTAEKAAREAQARLAEFEKASMSEQERAVAQARDEGRSEALREAAALVVESEVRAAAAGRSIDVEALLEGLNATRFLDDDGNVDRQAIAAWVDKVAPKPTEDASPPGWPDLGQGFRQPTAPSLADPLHDALVRKSG